MKFWIKTASKFHTNPKLLIGPTKDYTLSISIPILTNIKISVHYTRIIESLNITLRMKNNNSALSLRLWPNKKCK